MKLCDKLGVELAVGDTILTYDGNAVKIGTIKLFHKQYVILNYSRQMDGTSRHHKQVIKVS
jgi:hypothetical protein